MEPVKILMVTFSDNVLIGAGAVPMKYVSQGQVLDGRTLKLEYSDDRQFFVVRALEGTRTVFKQLVPFTQVISISVGPEEVAAKVAAK